MTMPAPVWIAFGVLILWPAVQIAALLLFKKRAQVLAGDAIRNIARTN